MPQVLYKTKQVWRSANKKILWVKIKLFLVFKENKIEIFIVSSAFLLECSGEKFFNPSLAPGPVETGYFGWAVVIII